jgi:anthranilate phosphoribosyltransferase
LERLERASRTLVIHEALEKLLAGEDLSRAEADRVMEELFSGRGTVVQRSAFYTALEMKGWTRDERVAFDSAQARHPGERALQSEDASPDQAAAFSEFIHIATVYAMRGDDMSRREAENAMEEMLRGQADDATIARLLTALRFKGEAVDEVVGFAEAMRRHAPRIFPDGHPIALEALVDTCGTGGDARGTFNVSTATAFVVAGAGVRVAKHGNRSHSSLCGSADVLEHFGARIDLPPEGVARCIEEVGIGFLFAPAMHSATRHVAKVRQELKFRTVFNLLGPLTNPAGASAQVVGVYDPGVTELMAQALGELGVKRAFVVHGEDGLDEISISGETYVSELRDGSVRSHSLIPEDFGLKRAPLEAIRGGDAKRNTELIRDVLGGESGSGDESEPRRDIVLANASAALVAAGRAEDFREGVAVAAESIDSGAARNKLESLIAFSQSQGHSARSAG